jgi:glycosyltransferase involved in cell wall biosynthesis
LHVTDHYPPVLGGIETHVAGLAQRQQIRGDDVTVLTSTPATGDGSLVEGASPVRILRARSMLEGAAVDFTTFDMVHAHISVVAPFSAPLAGLAARSGVPTVVTVHSMWSGMGPVPAMAAAAVGLRKAPVVWTAVSRVAADQLAMQLPQQTQVSILPNAVDTHPRRRTVPARPDHSVRLISTMRLARRKRPLQLLRMFESLQRLVEVPLQLTILGDGPLLGSLERQLIRAGLERTVTLTGRVEPTRVVDLLSTADLYVAPSIRESFGLAALEARCVGLPVVGHAASGMTDFIRHGVEGFLCASDSDLVAALRLLVVDDAVRRRISEHNRTVATDMTWANSLGLHDRVYADTCRRSRPQRPARLRKYLARAGY